MSIATPSSFTSPLILQGGASFARMSRSEFFQFCRLNENVRIERTAEGDLNIMPPTGGETGWRNGSITAQLVGWSVRDGGGLAFDSSTGFWLPNGAERSPDASWVRRERWNALSDEERKEFPPLAPDFVVELRSPSERLPDLRKKMQEYVANGVRLGWLIDPLDRRVEVYRPGAVVETLDTPATIAADPELPGFTLDVAQIW